MADKGIIFSAAMVRALLDGRKTQTRRLAKPRLSAPSLLNGEWADSYVLDPGNAEWLARDIPFAVGDRLYVREAYYQFGHWVPVEGQLTKGGRQKWAFVGVASMVQFDAPEGAFASARHRDHPLVPCWHKRLGRFMPRGLSRMWLAVTDVRVQRLQECSETDAIAEGIEGFACVGGTAWRDYGGGDGFNVRDSGAPAKRSYATLWSSLHTAEGERWQDNPWIVAVSFEVRQGNIEAALTIKEL